MARFTRLFKGLQSLLPSSGSERHLPDELAHTITPVMEIPGRAPGLEQIVTGQPSSVAALTPTLDIVAASPEEWVEVLYADVSHDSVTARNLQLALFSGPAPGFNTFLGRWTNFLTSLTAGQPSGFEPIFGTPTEATAGGERVCPQRPILVPPNGVLRMLGNTAAAAYTITVSVVIVRHPFPDRPMLW